MQYLLSEEEYRQFHEAHERQVAELNKKLLKVCQQVADHKPIKWGWGVPDDPKPWSCIHSQKDWYCDQCPVKDVCPEGRKKWSQ